MKAPKLHLNSGGIGEVYARRFASRLIASLTETRILAQAEKQRALIKLHTTAWRHMEAQA